MTVTTMLKRVFVGRPIATRDQEHQRLPKKIALATFSSDAISSTAYATEEILFVAALGAGSSLALGHKVLIPIGIVVAVLIASVVSSYRQTIFAYPHGGGSYLVSRDNLGRYPSLVAGASLLVDYVLTVAVSISAGVAAIVSLPALRDLRDHRVLLCLGLVLVITLGNLRGMKESGLIFAIPTYLFILGMSSLVIVGIVKHFTGHLGTVNDIPFDGRQTGGSLAIILVLRAFSSGAVALTGIEAIADGVPAFQPPEAKNAARTLTIMGFVLGTLFLGVSILGKFVQPVPTHDETVVSQMGRVVFGDGVIHVFLQIVTCAILVLAANTAYADFPRLSSIIARDGYLPRQLANRGDRLVFSNGVLFLALAASGLLVAFGGVTTRLIPLYAVGVFTSFTLSQLGMVMRGRSLREPGWKRRALVNGFGATMTAIVLVIVAVSKFTEGAWLPVVVIPIVIAAFLAVRRHYDRVNDAIAIRPDQVRRGYPNHTVVVLVSRVHRGVVEALEYARSLRPQHLAALYVSYEDDDRIAMERQWEEFDLDVPLEVVHSPYRELVDAVLLYLDELDARWDNDRITVIIPEFVVGRWFEHMLHNQSALRLKGKLLFRPGTVVTSVPYHVDLPHEPEPRPTDAAPVAEREKARD
jgi:amino acid transporter